MTLTRTVAAALLASTLMAAPSHAGQSGWLAKKAAPVAVGRGIGIMLSRTTKVDGSPVAQNEDISSGAKRVFDRAVELVRYGFNDRMCRETEYITKRFWVDQNDMTLATFAAQHEQCCKTASGQSLANITAALSAMPMFRGFRGSAVADPAFQVLLNEGHNSSLVMDMFKLGIASKDIPVSHCLAVVDQFRKQTIRFRFAPATSGHSGLIKSWAGFSDGIDRSDTRSLQNKIICVKSQPDFCPR